MSPLLFKPVKLRDDKGHRQATWLELFFDLAFVISVAALTKMLVANTTLEGLALYTGLFFAVFWAWNQLTWYSTHFDNGDVFFKIIYLGAILSVLILAASIERITQGDTKLFIISYVLLQVILATGWVRVFIHRRKLRPFSLVILINPIIGGIIFLISLLFPIPQQYYIWAVALIVQTSAVYIAWKTKKINIPVHRHHIVERYCLFTIIVMGETLVSVSVGLSSVPNSDGIITAIFGFVIIACIWWTYFNWNFKNIKKFEVLSNLFFFGYGHFFVFLAIAAFGAGLELAIHSAVHDGHLTLLERLLITLSPSLYLFSLSLMNRFSWNMPFDKKMTARIIVALLSITFALVTSHLSPVIFTGGIALLMVCLVIYEQIWCVKTGNSISV
jgi:low temperature requirement protein LtrA